MDEKLTSNNSDAIIAALSGIGGGITRAYFTYRFGVRMENERETKIDRNIRTLQNAQIAIMENEDHPNWRHPFYWAPFTLFRDWE